MKRIIIITLLLGLCGCAATVSMKNTAPPKAGKPLINRVAVLPFTDDKGDYVASALATVLSELNYQGGKAYTVLDRKIMKEIIAEQEFQMTLADPSTVIEFGLLIGIEGGFTGGVLYNQSVRNITESREKTVEYTRRVDNKTEIIQKKETYYVYCTKQDYDMTVNIKLTDYSTTGILYNKSFSRFISSKSCPDGNNSKNDFPSNKSDLGVESIELSLTSSTDPYVVMANDILYSVAKDLGEYTLLITAEIAKKDKTLSSDDKKIFKNALEHMENGNSEQACEIWGDLSRSNPDAPHVTYNMGLCSEIAGNYEDALNLYGKASRLADKHESMFDKSIDRVRKKISQGIQ